MDGQQSFEEYLFAYLNQSQHEFFDPQKIKGRAQEQFFKEREKEFPDHLQRVLGSITGKKILEVGSGSGWRSVSLALCGGEIYGLEPIEAGVEAAKLRGKRHPGLKTDFRKGVAEQLPYPTDFFDFVVSFQVIEHVQSIEKSLQEMYRVLKPGGQVYMETGNSLYPREEHYRIFWIPYMPKTVGKIYARLRGKNPSHLDHVNFMYRGATLHHMRRVGFIGSHDKFESRVLQKCSNPDTVTNNAFRKVLGVCKKLHVLPMVCYLVARIGFYPTLWLWGEKPKLNSGNP